MQQDMQYTMKQVRYRTLMIVFVGWQFVDIVNTALNIRALCNSEFKKKKKKGQGGNLKIDFTVSFLAEIIVLLQMHCRTRLYLLSKDKEGQWKRKRGRERERERESRFSAE